METWTIVATAGGVLGFGALVGVAWAWRKLESTKRWLAIGGFVLLGGVGAFLGMNATALAGPDVTRNVSAADDFDAPLDDF